MTYQEAIDLLWSKRKSLSYRMWKQAWLISSAILGSKRYPVDYNEANPELARPKPRIKMPPNLLKVEEERKKRNG